jgi:hypothetical protein
VYPEDRVLVGVINRKRDLKKAQLEHWYRVPKDKAPNGIRAEYVAFFLSKAFGELNGGIHYYARRTGIELARRRDLLPEESNHARADDTYYKLQFADLRRKDPPILNPTKRAIAFILTTWDRFEKAKVIADLYSEADEFVDRVFHALGQTQKHAERVWEASRQSDDGGAQIRIECNEGTVIASTKPNAGHVIQLPVSGSAADVQSSVDAIKAAIRQHGGPMMISVPIDG